MFYYYQLLDVSKLFLVDAVFPFLQKFYSKDSIHFLILPIQANLNLSELVPGSIANVHLRHLGALDKQKFHQVPK